MPGTGDFPWNELTNRIARECCIGYFMPTPEISVQRQVCLWQNHFLLGEMLGSEGKEFKQWALEELTAFGKASYRKKDNVFVPILTDGTNLEGYVVTEDGPLGPKGVVLELVPADPSVLWAYSMGYRVTQDEFMWEMAQSITKGNEFGDVGATAKDRPQLLTSTDCSNPYALLAFMELHRCTGHNEFWDMAKRIGDNILARRFHKGFFVASNKHIYTKFDAVDSLALLHLHAVLLKGILPIPEVWPSTPFFEDRYRDKDPILDNQLIYPLTESAEPPLSLQEAVAIGNLDLVKTLIENGAEVDGREDSFFRTALHRAAMSGHRDVLEYLLAKGAQVDAWNGFPGGMPLHYAAEKGHTEIAGLLIAHGADVNAKRTGYPSGDTPLHSAVRAGHKDIVELLISKGADVNAKNNEGQTPLDIVTIRNRKDIVELLVAKGADISLHSAVRQRLLEKLKELIEKGSDINATDFSGQTALHYAARRGYQEIVELLLANGANVNTKDNKGLTPAEMAMTRQRTQIAKLLIDNNADISSIHLAAFAGNLAKVKTFLQMGININTQDSDSRTPLHYAATADVTEFLIANGAKIHTEDKDGETPLHTTAAAGFKDVVELLIKKGADVNAKKSGDTPLSWAIWRNHKDVIRSLVINGADVNFKAKNVWPFLHYVVWNNDKDLVKLFVTHGADVNFTPKDDYSPLHYALWKENVESVKLLVNHGAKFNVKDHDEWTAFRYVVSSGNRELLEFFIAKGAKTSDFHTAAWLGDLNQVKHFVEQGTGVNTKDNHFQWTPLHWTAFTGPQDVVEFLLAKGANVNAKDEFNSTPLQYAAVNGHKELVVLLLAKGAKVNATDNWGSTPLHAAARQGHLEIIKLLITKGADIYAKTNKGETVISLANKKGHTEIVELLGKHDAENLPKADATKSVRFNDVADLFMTGEAPGPQQFGNYPRFGDVNGDGHEDLLVAGASRYNNNQGRLYLYYGGKKIDDKPDKIFTGENAGDYFGEHAYLVDVNGDGYADVVTGAPIYNNIQGRIYIFHGGPDMDENADLIIDGEPGTQGRFGLSVTAGDLNNDGYDDVVVTATFINNRTGRVYLFYGGDPMDTAVDLIFDGENKNDRFGRDIDNPKMIGDINGDGYGDLLISTRMWNYAHGVSGQGRAYLYYGGPGTSMDSTPDKIFTGENPLDDFGVSGCIFDIDNDDFADVIIGARGYNNYQGRVYIYWGGEDMDTVADKVFDGESGDAIGNFGHGLDAGWVNDDVYGDIIVAAPYYDQNTYSGRAYLFYGDTKAGMDTTCDNAFTVPTNKASWTQHAVLGDLHNDNYPDVVIGGPRYNKDQGRVWVYFNNPHKSK